MLRPAEFVSGTDSPFGSSLTKICPALKNDVPPRLNVTIRPSGDRLGAFAESVKFVSCTYSDGDVTGRRLFHEGRTAPQPLRAAQT